MKFYLLVFSMVKTFKSDQLAFFHSTILTQPKPSSLKNKPARLSAPVKFTDTFLFFPGCRNAFPEIPMETQPTALVLSTLKRINTRTLQRQQNMP